MRLAAPLHFRGGRSDVLWIRTPRRAFEKTCKAAGADCASPAVSADTEMTVNSREAGALPVATPVTTPPEASRIHLLYLEGIRGWAAVFVALHHVWQFVVTRSDAHELPRWFTAMTVFKFGGYAVPVFIVLSGYCLMLPIARSTNSELAGGVRQFAVRRARRILIPYYAALALSLLFIAGYPRMAVPTHTPWDTALPALAVDS